MDALWDLGKPIAFALAFTILLGLIALEVPRTVRALTKIFVCGYTVLLLAAVVAEDKVLAFIFVTLIGITLIVAMTAHLKGVRKVERVT